MKNRLIYQSSCYDCGPTSVLNGIRYLFEREKIPPVIIKKIFAMGLDAFNENGEPGKSGTSKASMRYMADWFNDYSEKCGFPIKAAFLDMDRAVLEKDGEILSCIQKGGCAVARVWLEKAGHYVLLTQQLSEDTIGVFDPYEKEPESEDPDRKWIDDDPYHRNREVRLSTFNQSDDADYAMGEPAKREVLLLWQTEG
ncbi:MAG: peptidase C39 [Clostridia bacterium]|nr:peptidase C39 [Clostridia bacterium]